MIDPKEALNILKSKEISFFTGVPDSLLKPLCNIIEKQGVSGEIKHITAANEGNAVALAAGSYLASGKIPLIYLQNSGLGNIINPLLSLTDKNVYNMPALYFIGWRGEPGIKDEPQHVTQGLLSEHLLEAVNMKYCILSADDDMGTFESRLKSAINYMKETFEPFAFLIKKGSFVELKDVETDGNKQVDAFLRRDALNEIVNILPENAVVISTTGKTSRELYEIRNERGHTHNKDFLTVGSMGHCSQIALGISLEKPNVPVYCIEGEGAVLMHMGALVVNGALARDNFFHILINNGAHDSVGGQPNFGAGIDFSEIAELCGYKNTFKVKTPKETTEILGKKYTGSSFLQIDVSLGSKADLSRPKESPIENKEIFIDFLNGLEG